MKDIFDKLDTIKTATDKYKFIEKLCGYEELKELKELHDKIVNGNKFVSSTSKNISKIINHPLWNSSMILKDIIKYYLLAKNKNYPSELCLEGAVLGVTLKKYLTTSARTLKISGAIFTIGGATTAVTGIGLIEFGVGITAISMADKIFKDADSLGSKTALLHCQLISQGGYLQTLKNVIGELSINNQGQNIIFKEASVLENISNPNNQTSKWSYKNNNRQNQLFKFEINNQQTKNYDYLTDIKTEYSALKEEISEIAKENNDNPDIYINEANNIIISDYLGIKSNTHEKQKLSKEIENKIDIFCKNSDIESTKNILEDLYQQPKQLYNDVYDLRKVLQNQDIPDTKKQEKIDDFNNKAQGVSDGFQALGMFGQLIGNKNVEKLGIIGDNIAKIAISYTMFDPKSALSTYSFIAMSAMAIFDAFRSRKDNTHVIIDCLQQYFKQLEDKMLNGFEHIDSHLREQDNLLFQIMSELSLQKDNVKYIMELNLLTYSFLKNDIDKSLTSINTNIEDLKNENYKQKYINHIKENYEPIINIIKHGNKHLQNGDIQNFIRNKLVDIKIFIDNISNQYPDIPISSDTAALLPIDATINLWLEKLENYSTSNTKVPDNVANPLLWNNLTLSTLFFISTLYPIEDIKSKSGKSNNKPKILSYDIQTLEKLKESGHKIIKTFKHERENIDYKKLLLDYQNNLLELLDTIEKYLNNDICRKITDHNKSKKIELRELIKDKLNEEWQEWKSYASINNNKRIRNIIDTIITSNWFCTYYHPTDYAYSKHFGPNEQNGLVEKNKYIERQQRQIFDQQQSIYEFVDSYLRDHYNSLASFSFADEILSNSSFVYFAKPTIDGLPILPLNPFFTQYIAEKNNILQLYYTASNLGLYSLKWDWSYTSEKNNNGTSNDISMTLMLSCIDSNNKQEKLITIKLPTFTSFYPTNEAIWKFWAGGEYAKDYRTSIVIHVDPGIGGANAHHHEVKVPITTINEGFYLDGYENTIKAETEEIKEENIIKLNNLVRDEFNKQYRKDTVGSALSDMLNKKESDIGKAFDKFKQSYRLLMRWKDISFYDTPESKDINIIFNKLLGTKDIENALQNSASNLEIFDNYFCSKGRNAILQNTNLASILDKKITEELTSKYNLTTSIDITLNKIDSLLKFYYTYADVKDERPIAHKHFKDAITSIMGSVIYTTASSKTFKTPTEKKNFLQDVLSNHLESIDDPEQSSLDKEILLKLTKESLEEILFTNKTILGKPISIIRNQLGIENQNQVLELIPNIVNNNSIEEEINITDDLELDSNFNNLIFSNIKLGNNHLPSPSDDISNDKASENILQSEQLDSDSNITPRSDTSTYSSYNGSLVIANRSETDEEYSTSDDISKSYGYSSDEGNLTPRDISDIGLIEGNTQSYKRLDDW